jgi:hypothetical protein
MDIAILECGRRREVLKMQEDDRFFDGFSWAVLTAFAGPVAACRFELGDTLYDTRRAYEGTWGEALPYISWSIQVRSPSKSATAQSQSGSVTFSDNWNQRVDFDLRDYRKNTKTEIETAQGRLYTLLWKGDLGCLDETREAPPVPVLAMNILSDLPKALDHFKGSAPATSRTLFLIPYDRSHELLRSKCQRIGDALSMRFDSGVLLASPEQAGLISETGFAPTARIACFCVDGKRSHVEDLLKQTLYRPAKEKETDRDNFRLASHGHLQAL